MTTYILGGGCFWCIDAIFAQLRGVVSVESGYAGGVGIPNYWRVVSGKTGHAEVVRVVFDESIIAAEIILDIFFLIHDPTSLNKQGADVGTQYRSVMFYSDTRQKEQFNTARTRAQAIREKPIVTELTKLDTFYTAETDHQDYYNQNSDAPYCQIVIDPKIIEAKKAYQTWFK